MTELSWMELNYTQLYTVCICFVIVESVKLYIRTLVTILQRLFGGEKYRRVVGIGRKKRELEMEKKIYHSVVDQFPKIARLERKIIQLELEEKDISLSHYVTYGIPIIFPIIYTGVSIAVYFSLVIAYRNTPIMLSSNLLWLHPIVLGILAFPTGVQGGVGAVYVILAAKTVYYLIGRVVNITKSHKNNKND